MKILVIHRQKTIHREVKWMLRGSASYIRCFQTGLDGLLASRVEYYDLIVCGTDLPVITGFELARSIRISSQNVNVPIVFITNELDEKRVRLGQTLRVLGMFKPAELNRTLPGLVGDTLLKVKYDIESSSPHRQN